jgi:hypothetical protein
MGSASSRRSVGRRQADEPACSVADAWFPEPRNVPLALPGHEGIFDGEAIVCGDDGRPAFHLLGHRLSGRPTGPVLRRRSWCSTFSNSTAKRFYPLSRHERQQRLESLVIGPPGWQVPRWFSGDDLTDVLDATRSLGLERWAAVPPTMARDPPTRLAYKTPAVAPNPELSTCLTVFGYQRTPPCAVVIPMSFSRSATGPPRESLLPQNGDDLDHVVRSAPRSPEADPIMPLHR